eukprot:1511841-Rhodomonas_salina.3
MSGTDLPYCVAACLRSVRYCDSQSYSRREAAYCYDIPHSLCAVRTDLAYGATSLCAPYAMSGTDLGRPYKITHPPHASDRTQGINLRAPYAMSGTDLAHGAISLRAPCAMSCTEIAYGAMRCPVLR